MQTSSEIGENVSEEAAAGFFFFYIADGRKQFRDKTGRRCFSDGAVISGVGGLIQKPSPWFIFQGLTQTGGFWSSGTDSVLLPWLNCCSRRRPWRRLSVLFFNFLLWFLHVADGAVALLAWALQEGIVHNSWALGQYLPEDCETRKSSCRQLRRFLAREQRRWRRREGGRGIGGGWRKDETRKRKGVQLLEPGRSSGVDGGQSSVKGRVRDPSWGVPFSFFFSTIFFSTPFNSRCVYWEWWGDSDPSEAWKPSLCSTCTEPSLNLSRCACWISPSPSWTTWWAPQTALSPTLTYPCLPECIPAHSCRLPISICPSFQWIWMLISTCEWMYLPAFTAAWSMLVPACLCTAASWGCLSRPAALCSFSACVHIWALLHLLRELHLVLFLISVVSSVQHGRTGKPKSRDSLEL